MDRSTKKKFLRIQNIFPPPLKKGTKKKGVNGNKRSKKGVNGFYDKCCHFYSSEKKGVKRSKKE